MQDSCLECRICHDQLCSICHRMTCDSCDLSACGNCVCMLHSGLIVCRLCEGRIMDEQSGKLGKEGKAWERKDEKERREINDRDEELHGTLLHTRVTKPHVHNQCVDNYLDQVLDDFVRRRGEWIGEWMDAYDKYGKGVLAFTLCASKRSFSSDYVYSKALKDSLPQTLDFERDMIISVIFKDPIFKCNCAKRRVVSR